LRDFRKLEEFSAGCGLRNIRLSTQFAGISALGAAIMLAGFCPKSKISPRMNTDRGIAKNAKIAKDRRKSCLNGEWGDPSPLAQDFG
jgi:hypothetical protein